MKLLKQYFSSHQAELDALNLENQGIVVHVSSKHSHSLGGLVTGAFSVGLWVVFDHQFNDAQSFIADDSFDVKDGFTDEELSNLKAEFQTESSTLLNRFIVWALFGLFTFGAITTSIIYYFCWTSQI